MKHLFLLLVLAGVGYGAWFFIPKARRDAGLRHLARHAVRLGVIALLLLALLALAYYIPSTHIL